MRITFLIPDDNLSGGVKVVAIYAGLLSGMGHQVAVIGHQKADRSRPRWRRWLPRFGKPVCGVAPESHFHGKGVSVTLYPAGYRLRASNFPDADIVVATWWATAEAVMRLPSAKGRKVYFVQHHEIHPGQPIERVKATLRLPMQKIVVSRWLQEIMAAQYGDTRAILVPNGVDLQQFHAPVRSRNPVPTVGYLYHEERYKGSDVAIEAIRLARRKRPDIRSIAFGRVALDEGPGDAGVTEYFRRPLQNEIPGIYGRCDVWLFASRLEGFGLPLLEAAACGTPLIATPAGAAGEIIAAGAGFLVPQEDPAAMADAIIHVLALEPNEWAALSAAAKSVATTYDWLASARKLEAVLNSLVGG